MSSRILKDPDNEEVNRLGDSGILCCVDLNPPTAPHPLLSGSSASTAFPLLANEDAPWTLLRGSHDERLALRCVETLFKDSA